MDALIPILGGFLVWLYLRQTGAIAGGPGSVDSSGAASNGNFVPVPPGVPTSLPLHPVVLPAGPLDPRSAGLVNVPQSPAVQAPKGPVLTGGQTITHLQDASGHVFAVPAAPWIPGPEDPGTIVVQGGTLQYLYSYVTNLPGFSKTKVLPAGDWSADVHGAALDLPAYNPLLFGLDPATPVTFDQFFQLASQYYAQHPSPTAFNTFLNMGVGGLGYRALGTRSPFAA